MASPEGIISFALKNGIPMSYLFAKGVLQSPFKAIPTLYRIGRAVKNPGRNIADALMYLPITGVGAYALLNRSIKNFEATQGPIARRIEMASTTPLTAIKTGSHEKEADASIGAMAPHMLGMHALGSTINQALHSVQAPFGDISDVLSYKTYKSLFPGIGGMISYTRAPEEALKSTMSGFGKELGKGVATGLKGIINNVMEKNTQIALASPRRKMILEQLRREDNIIAQAPIQVLLEAYHSMSKVAPILSTDKNAVKSFLRTVATSPEGGIDWNTMKGLADAEKSIRNIKSESVSVTL